jgi:hypothetical protein
VRTTTAPDPAWRIDDRVTVTAVPLEPRSDGGQDEHWQARVFEGATSVNVDVIVTGTAVCTGEGVNEEAVKSFVKRKLDSIPHREERTRVEALPDLDLTLDSTDVG